MHQPLHLYPESEIKALGVQFGWSDIEVAHAIHKHGESVAAAQVTRVNGREDTRVRPCERECVVQSPSGVFLHCPAFPSPCTYVRAVQHGFEIGCWTHEEWAALPKREAWSASGGPEPGARLPATASTRRIRSAASRAPRSVAVSNQI